jgi:hypothetical protein
MDGTNGLKETAPVTAPVASNTLGVNVFTAPGKAMVGDRLKKTATSDQELFDQMTELYPHWVANQSWLMFGFPQA